jgi:diguanylate cyclase (GGDEF)-like protein
MRHLAKKQAAPLAVHTTRLTLRQRLGLFAVAGVLMVLVVAVAGLVALNDVQTANDEINALSRAQRYHQDGDMMHDAIRGDTYLAILSAEGAVDVSQEDVRAALAGDADRFRNDLAANRTGDLPESARTAIDAVATPLGDYINEATRIVDLAFEDVAAAKRSLPEFGQRFVALQDAQEVVTTELSALTDAARQRGDDVDGRAKVLLLIAVGASIALLGGIAFLFSRSLVRSLDRLGAVAGSIAAGDLAARVQITGDDEIGTLAHAINEMAGDLTTLVGKMEANADRDGFGSQLAEALEMADTEDDALLVVGRAMSVISSNNPMEILLADSSKAHLSRAAEHPVTGAPCCPVESPYSCVAVRRGNPVVFENSESLNACPKLRERGAGPISAVCVPVTFMGRAMGVLHAAGPVDNPLAPDEVTRLTTLATQSGARIGTVRSFERSQLQATTDGLTGLNNRRTIETEARGLLKAGQTAAIVMADLDHFKLLNDTYGHEAGDRALRVFSQTVEQSLRETDLAGRFGGEEFLLVFPGTPTGVAADVLNRLRSRLETAIAEAGMPSFTASFGVVDSTMAKSLDEALKMADNALYRAKREGRNRVVIADEADAASADVTVASASLIGSDSRPADRKLSTVGAFQRAASLDDPMPQRPDQY